MLAVDKTGEIDFMEFVICIWNLCTLTSDSVGKFLFELYDDDDSGEIEFNELAVRQCGVVDHAWLVLARKRVCPGSYLLTGLEIMSSPVILANTTQRGHSRTAHSPAPTPTGQGASN